MSSRIPVLHLIGNLNVGGAERQLITLLQAFDRDDFEHHLGLLHMPGFLIAKAREIEDLRVVEFGFRHKHFVPSMGRIVRYLRQNDIQVLHAHLHLVAVYGRVAARIAGTPATVYTEHSDVGARSWVERVAERALVPWTGTKIAVSEEQRELTQELEGFPAAKVRVISNSIDVDEFSPDPEVRGAVRDELGFEPGDVVVGIVGNLHERKRVDHLIDHAAALRMAHPDLRLLVVGDGVDRPMLEARARGLGVADHVRFVGAQSQVATFMRAMDVLAITSRWEGLPINMLEAMACGLPVVATDTGDIRRVVDAAAAGHVVAVDDEVGFREALASLVADPVRRAELGARARAYAVREHGSRRNAARLEAIYRELLGVGDAGSVDSPSAIT